MKIWIKMTAGVIIGVLLGFILPAADESLNEVFSYLAELIINIGRYAVFPLVFFSLAYGIFELRQEKKLLRVYGRTILYLIISSVLLVIIGTLSVLFFSPDRIPIIIEVESIFTVPGIKEILLEIFPRNFFLVFINNGNFLLPVFFLASFLGLNFSFDKVETRPVTQFFNAMSRIFYHINSFVIEILSLGMIILITYLIMLIRGTSEISLFGQLILLLSIDSFIVIFGVFPLILYFAGGRENPYKWMYAVIAPALAGFASGDSYFSLTTLIRHGKENLGIPRSIASTTFPLFALFGKAGTAMVTSISFTIILKSYSSLGIDWIGVLVIIGLSIIVSFITGSIPGMGVFVSLSLISTMFGKGMENGYLIIKPVIPLLLSFGVMLDVITAAVSSMLVARHEEMQKQIEIHDYI